MKKFFVILMLMSGAAQAAVATQTDRLFDIEVVIFKRAVSPQDTREAWPEYPEKLNLDNAHRFEEQEYLDDRGIILLDELDYQLTEYKEKLDQHAGYEVLVHTAWQQPDLSKRNAPLFLISAGQDYSQRFNAEGLPVEQLEQLTTDESSVIDPLDGATIERLVEEPSTPLTELLGQFKIYINHYLYLESTLELNVPTVQDVVLQTEEPEIEAQPAAVEELSLSEPFIDMSILDIEEDSNTQFGGFQEVTPTVITTEVLKPHRFEQRRRMRSGEIHYLDHPLLGMVVQVRRAN